MDPWERRDDETPMAYAAFKEYLDQGADRSTAHVARALGKSKTIMDRWSSRHEWVSRSRAFDSIPAMATAEAYADVARDIAEQHRKLADKLMTKLDKALDKLPDGNSPSVPWSTAHGAARQGHAFVTELVKPESTRGEEITAAIENLLNKLAGE